MRSIVAIDPGKNGGIVWGSSLNGEDIGFEKTPDTLKGLYTLLDVIQCECSPHAYMELNTGFMSGIKSSTKRAGEEDSEEGGVSPKAMFSFGKTTGHIEMGLMAVGIPCTQVNPIKWMNAAGVIRVAKSTMEPAAWKRFLQAEARKQFPDIPPAKITLAVCDALLIYRAAITGRL